MLWTIALIFVIGTGYYIGTHKNPSPPITKPTPTTVPTKQPRPQPEADRPLDETPTLQAASPSGIVTEE